MMKMEEVMGEMFKEPHAPIEKRAVTNLERALRDLAVKGKAEPLVTFEALGVISRGAPLRSARTFIDREEMLAAIGLQGFRLRQVAYELRMDHRLEGDKVLHVERQMMSAQTIH